MRQGELVKESECVLRNDSQKETEGEKERSERGRKRGTHMNKQVPQGERGEREREKQKGPRKIYRKRGRRENTQKS